MTRKTRSIAALGFLLSLALFAPAVPAAELAAPAPASAHAVIQITDKHGGESGTATVTGEEQVTTSSSYDDATGEPIKVTFNCDANAGSGFSEVPEDADRSVHCTYPDPGRKSFMVFAQGADGEWEYLGREIYINPASEAPSSLDLAVPAGVDPSALHLPVVVGGNTSKANVSIERYVGMTGHMLESAPCITATYRVSSPQCYLVDHAPPGLLNLQLKAWNSLPGYADVQPVTPNVVATNPKTFDKFSSSFTTKKIKGACRVTSVFSFISETAYKYKVKGMIQTRKRSKASSARWEKLTAKSASQEAAGSYFLQEQSAAVSISRKKKSVERLVQHGGKFRVTFSYKFYPSGTVAHNYNQRASLNLKKCITR